MIRSQSEWSTPAELEPRVSEAFIDLFRDYTGWIWFVVEVTLGITGTPVVVRVNSSSSRWRPLDAGCVLTA